MKLKDRWYYGRRDPLSVSEAVRGQCSDYGSDSRGALESVEQKVDQVVGVLSKLVEALHDNGFLTDEQVFKMLPSYEESK